RGSLSEAQQRAQHLELRTKRVEMTRSGNLYSVYPGCREASRSSRPSPGRASDAVPSSSPISRAKELLHSRLVGGRRRPRPLADAPLDRLPTLLRLLPFRTSRCANVPRDPVPSNPTKEEDFPPLPWGKGRGEGDVAIHRDERLQQALCVEGPVRAS